MSSGEISVGIIALSAETRELLRIQMSATGLGAVELELDQYCTAVGDRSMRRFLETRPDIVIVDMQDNQAAIQSLHVLHTALPETWLFVSSDSNDPQLIIDAMRAGAREFLPKPIPPRILAQALERYLTEKQLYRQAKGIGQIYCITSAKGGVGATSVAINTATALVSAPQTRVALIDLNGPVGDASVHLNLKPQFTVSDALSSASRLDGVLLESYMSHVQNLAVLPGPKEYWVDRMPDAEALATMLEVAVQTYTHVFVDIPSSLNKDHLSTVAAMAAGVMIVMTPELPALWRTERLLRFLATRGLTDKLRIVINRSRKKDDIPENEIRKVLNHPVYWKLPNNYRMSIEAINTGKPLVSINHSELARSYRELAHQLTDTPMSEKRRGLFGRFS